MVLNRFTYSHFSCQYPDDDKLPAQEESVFMADHHQAAGSIAADMVGMAVYKVIV